MSTRKDQEGPLTAAAAAFERELGRYERLAAELHRTPVTSEKTLQRSKRLLTDCAECEEQLSVMLQRLLLAMNHARETQQACMQQSLDAAHSLQSRAAEFQALLERVANLGQLARDANGPVAAVAEQSAGGTPQAELLTALTEVGTRIDSTLQEADQVARAAEDGDWPDIAREVKNLRQQMQSARGRVLEACQRMTAGES